MKIKSNAGFFAHRALVTVTNLFVVAAFFLCAQTSLRAQNVNATLTGTATDQSGALLPGVMVRITNPETGFQREVQSSDNGTFTFPALPPATYIVSANKDGFAPAEFNNLTLNVNDNRSLRIEMKVGAVGETVTVNAEASLIEQSASQATTIDRTFVGNLPLNGRSFQSLILLSPGVVPVQSDENNPGQFSVNGQRTNANYFTIDGVSANIASNTGSAVLQGQALSGSLPGFSALGTTSTLVPVDALEEFKIQTSTYTAQYGRQPGGQVQLVTRSGKSQFHGSLFDYVRNEAFDANNWFNNANRIGRQPLRQNQFGGTFSGPVYLPNFGEGGPVFSNGKKRTFFFFSYEGLRLLLPTTENVEVPSLRLRAAATPSFRAILNAYPLPTGPETIVGGVPSGAAPYLAAFSNPKNTDSYGIRVDHNITDTMTLFGRYSDSSSQDGQRTLSFLSANRGKTRSLTLGTTFAGKAFTNEITFNYSTSQGKTGSRGDNFGGAVPVDPSLLVSGYSGPGITTGTVFLIFSPTIPGFQLGDSQNSYQRQLNIVDNVSVTKGNHQLKFGVDYRRLMPTYEPIAFSQSIFVSDPSQIVSGVPFITSLNARKAVEPRINNYSAYIQDTWKVNQRLTLDLGLRYELNPPPYDANGTKPVAITGIVGADVSKATLAPPGAPFYKTFKTAFAPRFGAVYLLNKNAGRETVLRGGFGVYYDLGSGQALNVFNFYPFFSSAFLFNAPFPLPPAQAVPPSFPPASLPLQSSVLAMNENLKLPYTLQWNFGVEQSLGKDQAISISYVASAGRRLLGRQVLNLGGGFFGPRPNPNFQDLEYTFNGPTSDYKSLQIQFRRRLSRGLQALVNYTLAHATDEISDEVNPALLRGNASFDVRHNFSAAFTYDFPTFGGNSIVKAISRNWSADSTIYLQSGQPIDIFAGTNITSNGRRQPVRADLVSGVPVWIEQTGVPGGRRLNPAAFARPPGCGFNCFTRQGTLGRNTIYGPGIFQVNLGLRREFGLTEKLKFQLRAEAFNVFNRPHFSNFQTILSAGNFGVARNTLNKSLGGLNSLYQIGGERSLQFSARLSF